MKQTADFDRVQAQMRPGVLTQPGFLGEDARKLADILDADNAAVLRLGLTHRGIAGRLAEFRAAGAGGLGTEVPVAPHFEVRVDGARGVLPCPSAIPGCSTSCSPSSATAGWAKRSSVPISSCT